MRKLYDDFEDYELDDSETLRRVLREQAREELRFASRRRRAKTKKYPSGTLDFDDELETDDHFGDYEDFDDYDEDEFDSYAGVTDWR